MGGEVHFICPFREASNNFIYMHSLSSKVYLVIAESKAEK